MKKKTFRLLPLAFVATAVTGVGLHIAGHGADHQVWHGWAVAHVIAALLWLISGAQHIIRHRTWYKAVATRGPGRRSVTTLVLSLVFVAEVITGIVLFVCADGANSGIGLWHYWLGLLLTVLSVIHIASRCLVLKKVDSKRVKE